MNAPYGNTDERLMLSLLQGSDSLASWQANLFFEPTKFEVSYNLSELNLKFVTEGEKLKVVYLIICSTGYRRACS